MEHSISAQPNLCTYISVRPRRKYVIEVRSDEYLTGKKTVELQKAQSGSVALALG